MKPVGLRQVEAAKADGRWDTSNGSLATVTPPPDSLEALRKDKKAAAFFATLTRRNRYAILYRL